jgi:hypothetical protein
MNRQRLNRNVNRNNNGLISTVHKRKQNRRRQVLTTNVLPPIVRKNLMSAKHSETIKVSTFIQSFLGSPQYIFTSPGTNYWNFSSILGSSTNFTNQVNVYASFRITGFKAEIQRVQDNAIGVYSSNQYYSAWLGCTPQFTSTSPATNLQQSSIAVEFDALVSTRQRCAFDFEPMFVNPLSGNTAHFFGGWNALGSNYTNMPGCFIIQSSNPSLNALTTTQLFQCTLFIDCEFASDYA